MKKEYEEKQRKKKEKEEAEKSKDKDKDKEKEKEKESEEKTNEAKKPSSSEKVRIPLDTASGKFQEAHISPADREYHEGRRGASSLCASQVRPHPICYRMKRLSSASHCMSLLTLTQIILPKSSRHETTS